MKISQNVYEGLNFSHVKFYHDLSAGLKKFPRKPQNFGDNWPLASMRVPSVENKAKNKRGSNLKRTEKWKGRTPLAKLEKGRAEASGSGNQENNAITKKKLSL